MSDTDQQQATRYAPASPAEEQALRALRKTENVTIVGALYASDAGFHHECPGKIFVDYYQGEDGHTYVGVSSWYECDQTLEILGEVQIP